MGREIEKRGPVTDLVERYRPDFTAIAPSHVDPDAFIQLAIAYIRRDPKLREAVSHNPASLILTLRECAALGHMPQKGIFTLVGFNDKQAEGGMSVVGIEEVRGVIQRMYRAGGIKTPHVQTVRENDWAPEHMRRTGERVRPKWNPATMTLPDHAFDEYASFEERGNLIAVYAWADMTAGGISQVVWLNRSQVDRYRQVARNQNVWANWEPEMWEKSALHRLEKFLPMSATYLNVVARMEAASSRTFQDLPDLPPLRGMLIPLDEDDPPRNVIEAHPVDMGGASFDDPVVS